MALRGATRSHIVAGRPASNLFNLGFWLSATGLDERAAIWDKRRNDKKSAFVAARCDARWTSLCSKEMSPIQTIFGTEFQFPLDKRTRLIGTNYADVALLLI